ncbi:MAG TPA: prepilin-type N-terminal cleavage/methylation domain-containing protein [Clostridia bacterium]|nr:prepilin-type N-terminal cleavage/methylation domain-containing protein [Clostridia bacterium]
MFKAMLKKSKSNKGFTLIELIVVIAIIAILALILVPRFAGFTDRAKVSADAATAKTIESAVQTMIAGGELSGNCSFNIDNKTLVTGATGVTGSAIQPDLQELLGTNLQQQTGVKKGFKVTISGSAITVEGQK